MSRRLVVLALVGALAVTATSNVAGACSCAPVTAAAMVETADIVFVGEEIARAPLNRDRNEFEWASVAVTFQVTEAYKGEVAGQITLLTGSGDADCGVGPLTELTGITSSTDSGQPTFDICGSLHSPAAIAALLDPIPTVDLPELPPPLPADGGLGVVPWVLGAGLAAMAGALVVTRRRRQSPDGWQDGWSGGN